VDLTSGCARRDGATIPASLDNQIGLAAEIAANLLPAASDLRAVAAEHGG
jgi:hypothetical protein